VLDFGKTTSNASILSITEGVFEVCSNSRSSEFGWCGWNQKVIDWLVETFRQTEGLDLSRDKMAIQRLTETVERANVALAQGLEAQIDLPFITASASGPKHLNAQLNSRQLRQLTGGLVEACSDLIEEAILTAGLAEGEIDDVIVVGGPLMPAVHEVIRQLTGKDARKGISADQAVAIGAAIQADRLKEIEVR
jgi:molecular chaperone DnaK